jgi:arginyl-tRNA synthetase
MSGRKGLGVKADDLLNRLEEDALAEVSRAIRILRTVEKRNIAHQIAVGALALFSI